MLICLDAGHAINGAVGASGQGYKEEVETRRIVAHLERKLNALGHSVVICSCDNENNANRQLEKIVNKANSVNADLFISIHLNSYSSSSAQGVETFSFSDSGASHIYATKVQNEMVKLGYTNRGKKQANFYVLRKTKAPAILVECGFITSPVDMKIYNPETIADKIVYGVTGKLPSEQTKNIFYRVFSGSFKNKENALKLQNELRAKGYDSFIEVKEV